MGLLSDKVNLFGWGHRRPYIFIGLFIQTLCLIIVPYVNPATHFWLFVLIAFMLQTGMALYDTCTDGMAIDTTPPEEESIIQGFMVGGRAIGTILLASVVGILANQGHWNFVFWLLAILTLIPLPFVIRMSEPKEVEQREFQWGAFAQFKRTPIILLSIIGFLIFFIIAGVNQVMNPFLTETLDISLQTAGNVASSVGHRRSAGGMLTGWLIKKVGFNRMLLVVIVIGAMSIGRYDSYQFMSMMWMLVILFGYSYGSYQTTTMPVHGQCRPQCGCHHVLHLYGHIQYWTGCRYGGHRHVDCPSGLSPSLLIFAGLNLLLIPLAMQFVLRKKAVVELQPA